MTAALSAVLIGAAAACGSPTAFDHPTGSDERVLVVGSIAGLVTPENDFMGLPRVTIMGDGTAIFTREGAYLQDGIEVVDQRTLSADGMQQALRIASSAGLLETRDLSGYDDDGGATVVHVWVDDEQFTNGAYGSDDEPDRNRDRIREFVADLDAFLRSDGDQLGPITAYQPEEYDVLARQIDEQSLASFEPQDFVEWPDQIPRDLIDAGVCSRVDAHDVGDALDADNLPVLIADGDTRYLVAVRPVLPGVACR
ncbi:hypothetical protein [Ilumatobacter sp.]|uniref:hypothetical protein n=1 Tax=Ilumatobacter sp. TaxID=1967498 RepID=UPI003AF577EC